MTEREFGLRSAGDHKLIPRIRQGMVTLSRIERAEAFIEAAQRLPDQGPMPPLPPPPHEGRAA
ncbi:hypothetical protein SAMN02982994_5505 [Azospirillum lipoferum]|nr:hypothetical protein SAMN02982994_5505 [Azospirillum lipoferum]